jgi:hypothetical protein
MQASAGGWKRSTLLQGNGSQQLLDNASSFNQEKNMARVLAALLSTTLQESLNKE